MMLYLAIVSTIFALPLLTVHLVAVTRDVRSGAMNFWFGLSLAGYGVLGAALLLPLVWHVALT